MALVFLSLQCEISLSAFQDVLVGIEYGKGRKVDFACFRIMGPSSPIWLISCSETRPRLSRTIFVGNLVEECGERDLRFVERQGGSGSGSCGVCVLMLRNSHRKKFEEYGRVADVRLARSGRKHRGYGFVQFEDAATAAAV